MRRVPPEHKVYLLLETMGTLFFMGALVLRSPFVKVVKEHLSKILLLEMKLKPHLSLGPIMQFHALPRQGSP